MKIDVTERAVKWFEDELALEKGDSVRFFGKTYGNTEVHEGFSIGMSVDQPDSEPLAQKEVNEVTYFAGKEDEWFFSGYNLEIDLDTKLEEPVYHFQETQS
ncbi:iron-sulfur cluster biosynthesis protein [Marinilactibacillus sp. 15R]|uniref:Uncharacterized protein YneR n=1 Tax=Marinilactibacillus piezotolerans TaxID=258723 RepID=A0A1I3WEF7_9LACT|nr:MULTISPECIES: iron-sulfur cluster biosynthesis protein [Marinilactibacillus]API88176.1 iron-sulfur cluster biosynthesis protein [Marinilactibacillus sp. 15R]SFK06064.1 Uncharacterized protein YneR [Marinilactibacillus piezotolerans]